MKITKANKLILKTTCGNETLEIIRITKAGIYARDPKFSGQPTYVTGFHSFGTKWFWQAIKDGILIVVPA